MVFGSIASLVVFTRLQPPVPPTNQLESSEPKPSSGPFLIWAGLRLHLLRVTLPRERRRTAGCGKRTPSAPRTVRLPPKPRTSAAAEMSEVSPKLKWYQFRLRTFLVLGPGVALCLAVYINQRNDVANKNALANVIQKSGGSVPSWQLDHPGSFAWMTLNSDFGLKSVE